MKKVSSLRNKTLYHLENYITNHYKSSFQWIKYNNHLLGTFVTLFAPCSIRTKNSEIVNPSTQPKYGTHTNEILKNFGYSDKQITEFKIKKIVSDSWSETYCPPGNPWESQVFSLSKL